MRKETCYQKNTEMVTRDIADETILMPLFKASDEVNCIYSLNEHAAFIWQLIDGQNSFDAIKKIALESYEGTEEDVERELVSLFKDLQDIEAIKEVQ